MLISSKTIFGCFGFSCLEMCSEEKIFNPSPGYLYHEQEGLYTCASSCALVLLNELGAKSLPIESHSEAKLHKIMTMANHGFPDRGVLFADLVHFLNAYEEAGAKLVKAKFYLNMNEKQAKTFIRECRGVMKKLASSLWGKHEKSPELMREKLMSQHKTGHSFIVPLFMPSKQNAHYILIRKERASENKLVMMDPASGLNYKLDYNDFIKYFFNHKTFKLEGTRCFFFGAIISINKA